VSKFAEYDATPRQDGPSAPSRIRAATLEDIATLAKIAQEREGGRLEEHQARFGREIGSMPSQDRCLLVAATSGTEVLGFGRVVRFTPPSNAPENVAPAGFYLAGLIVDPASRRRGIARGITSARLEWVRTRSSDLWYFANARNAVSIALHAAFGFEEVTRDFWHPEASFEGGLGILFRLRFGQK